MSPESSARAAGAGRSRRPADRAVLTRRRLLQLGVAAGIGWAAGPELAARAASPHPRGQTAGAPDAGAPTALTTAGLVAPVGLGVDDVFFGWHAGAGRRRAAQTAYRITVSRPTLAGPGAGHSVPVWDSGRVPSAAQAFVAYAGPALAPDTTYEWKVQTWDGNEVATSAAARFDTGLGDADWRAAWIKRLTVEPPPDDSTAFAVQSGFGVWLDEDEFSYVRHEVVLGRSPIVRARAYVSADQLYELYVNGVMVGKGLAYQFPDSQYYETWDVTSLLRPGAANAIGILYTWQGPAKGHPAGTPGTIAHVSVLHADGTSEVISTDGAWKALPGAWLPGRQRDEEGDPVDYTESIDGAAVPLGWAEPGYDDAAWAPATVLGAHPTTPWMHLVPLRTRMVFEPVPAVSVTRLASGSLVADFGKVYAAIPQVGFRAGVPARVVTMHAGYLLDSPSGQVSTSHGTQHTDMSYSYVQRGGRETFRAFDYLGFRYLQIDDPGESLTTADVVALTKHVAVPDEHAGTFTSSDATVDAVFELARHSALFCMQEQFVDTPTREKGSWLWDGHSESMTALVAFGDHNQTRKSLLEFAQSQARYWPNGAVNKIYPTALGADQLAYFTAIYVEWVWNYWLHTGDAALLGRLYPVVSKVSDFISASVSKATGLVTDIPSATDVSMHPTDTTMNLLAVNVFRRVADIASALGRPASEVNRQEARRDGLVSAVNRHLSRPDGLYADGLDASGVPIPSSSQWTDAYALLFGVVPPGRMPVVVDHVVALGMATEPVFAADMLEALRLFGQDVAILRLLTDASRPGWANILARGGTFTWEVWNPSDTDVPVSPLASFYGGDSMSHGWGSNVLVVIQRALLGVVPMGPGFSRFAVTPPLHALDHAAGRVPTPAGPITVSWERGAAAFGLDVTVPANTAATVSLPAAAGAAVTEGGAPVSRAPGVTSVSRSGPYVVVDVGAGGYSFKVS